MTSEFLRNDQARSSRTPKQLNDIAVPRLHLG